MNKHWPEVEWFFVVDTDEFLTLNLPLDQLLHDIPACAQSVTFPRFAFLPKNEEQITQSHLAFYQRIEQLYLQTKLSDLDSSYDLLPNITSSQNSTFMEWTARADNYKSFWRMGRDYSGNVGHNLIGYYENYWRVNGFMAGIYMQEFPVRSVE